MKLIPVTDPRIASYIRLGLSETPTAIGGLIPKKFDSYARVFAPLGDDGPTWSALAKQVGVAFDAETPWSSFPTHIRRMMQPTMGSLGPQLTIRLAEIFMPFTRADLSCYFLFWLGYGGFKLSANVSTVNLPEGREMAIFQGELADAVLSLEEVPFQRQSNRWFPLDGEWCLAGDIYSTSAIVGGSVAVINALCSTSGVETLRLDRNSSLLISEL